MATPSARPLEGVPEGTLVEPRKNGQSLTDTEVGELTA